MELVQLETTLWKTSAGLELLGSTEVAVKNRGVGCVFA